MQLDLWVPAPRGSGVPAVPRECLPVRQAQGREPQPAEDAGRRRPARGPGRRPGGGGARPAPRPDAAGVPASREALSLLREAAGLLTDAHHATEPARRYPLAYLAALRGGAAALALRPRARPRRGEPRDVWHRLTEAEPELAEWAAFFASCSRTRTAVEAGIERLVDRDTADELLHRSELFVRRVQELLPR
ncbi:SAV_6107 family HEPN domain-containing protein [Pseudonocardia phyllosphaerae]|uniref:SAV_6107 family HEPN domain-containing protein n=1 Tax=Pseudonocardia phyllosphaerae TaxID=3390502 RepID=UPI00397AB977